MQADTLTQIVTVGGPVAAVLAFFVTAFLKGWIVPGYIYRRELQTNRDLTIAVLKSAEASRLVLETTRQRDRDELDREADHI